MACWLVAILTLLGMIIGVILLGVLLAGLAWVYINFLGSMVEKYPKSFAIIAITLVVAFLFMIWVSIYLDCIEDRQPKIETETLMLIK